MENNRAKVLNNATPFEIRLDVLKMANEMLTTEKMIERSNFQSQMSVLSSTDIAKAAELATLSAPKMYSVDDVVARASTLYSFVTSKSGTVTPREDENK